MNTLASQCITKVVEGLASTLEEAFQTSSRTTRPVIKLAGAQVEDDETKPQGKEAVVVHDLDAIQLDALRKRAAEGAVTLSRLATLLRAAEKLKLPSEKEKPAIAKNRVLTLATKEEDNNACAPMTVKVSVPSFTAREALRASRKRLRGEDNEDDTRRDVGDEGGRTSAAHRCIFPIMRFVSLSEGLQQVVGPVGTHSLTSGSLSNGTVAQLVNPAASEKVVIRKGRKPAYNTILGSNCGDDNNVREYSAHRSPTLGHAVRFLTETQSAERSALLRFGLFPSLCSTNALPSSGPTSSSSAILNSALLAVEAAANEYERLQREADAVLTREHLTLITLGQLQSDLPEIRERLGESKGVADGVGIKVLRVEGGVASLSLRGMCIVNVWYNGGLRRWVLVGFMWTIFDVSGVRSVCEDTSANVGSSGSTPATVGGLANGTLLSLAHYSHQQIQSKIAAEVSTSLLSGIMVALRCCAGAVLQHVHNRVVAASGGSASLVIEGFMCRCKTEATRGAASVSLFCQPVVSRESADSQVTLTNNSSTVVRIHYESRKGQLIKGLLVGTDTDKHIMRPALETLFLAGSESTASNHRADCPSSPCSDSMELFVECHLLANMASMAGLQNIPDLNAAGASDAGWGRLREALPTVTGTPVALLSLPRILSPLK